MVLLGEGCVGKTSLVLRYCQNTFNEKHLTTLQVTTYPSPPPSSPAATNTQCGAPTTLVCYWRLRLPDRPVVAAAQRARKGGLWHSAGPRGLVHLRPLSATHESPDPFGVVMRTAFRLQASFLKKRLNLGGKRVDLAIWDTAGQERFHALGPIYYRDSNGAVLVYDITDEDSFNKV